MICCRCSKDKADGYIHLGNTLFLMCSPCGDWIGKNVPNAEWKLMKGKKK